LKEVEMAQDYGRDEQNYGSTAVDDSYGNAQQYRRVMGASTLTGDRVVNAAGDDLGKINEIMIDTRSGRVAYAVLSFGGFLGMGDKLFAIPWDRMALDQNRRCFVLNVDKATLERAPGFDKDNWPDMADQSWGSQIYSYYGSRPYWNELG
jgi:sporulation protein YlmC with PRC-barrel domain